AYMTLPTDINKITSVLNFSLEHTGYDIAAPIRNLFLLYHRIEQPAVYAEIHTFLAEKNEAFAARVTGSDHIRYIREFFYHRAHAEHILQQEEPTQLEGDARLQEQLTEHIEHL